ncbi:hypothetical protein ACU5P1_13480 [Pseudomonas plecoglossicida]|uniref:Secretion system X translation initiation factor n=2 Tax=Pseudomonas plecoglossicida TaxID=70775 RepID=A0AAD0VSC2_PSEDL|nr:hypothetical protein [Pseudomonas plecoglossicida]AXM94995.1 hypothetical protein DVB73_03800 [Pseudomonas plecoglossicida]EPB94142.1 hypothetical protein L321_20002 [Pseudomonas plecoglossicida NB2011]QLB55741.1 hypothetical protein HAV28_13345 [Pseudomonas plecoglossicida]GLR36011.1 hypothetical protein GCM10011247_14080 [Pseudomonas plecoglossicida]
MNTQRAVMWAGFLGLSGALAWAPGHWFGEESEVASIAGKPAATGSAAPAAPVAAGLPAKGPEQASRDLFPRQQWTKPQALATVTEQPVVAAPVVAAAATAPALPFQFVGRIGDREDLQIFLQSGEKLYVVRQGDVIDQTYRLDRVSANELDLVYLPLHQSQTLSVGSAP